MPEWKEEVRKRLSGLNLAPAQEAEIVLTGAGDPERLEGRRVSTNRFPLLGVEPQIGRVFTAAEDQPGSERVVLLSWLMATQVWW